MDHTLNSKTGKFILLATILGSGMAFLDGTVVNIAIPTIQKTLNANLIEVEWVINLYALMLSSLILISGSLGDRFGRKKIFLLGIVIFTLASFLCGISASILLLIIFRGLQGIGASLMVPGSLSIINTSFSESHRGRVIGLWSGFAGGVAALGPFLGGFLVQSLGWPAIFYINLPLGVLAFFISLKYIPETRNEDHKNLDIWGTILVFLGLLGIVYGLISGAERGWSNPLILFSLAGGTLFLVLFIWVEAKIKNPLVPFQIFKSPLVVGANIATLFLYFALSGVIFFLVLNFQQVQHYSPVWSGLGLLPPVLLITFLSGPAGVLADKIGPRLPMILGPIIVSAGMFLLTLAGREANYFLQFLPGLILFGLGMSLVIAPLTKSALEVESKYSGAASGVNNAITRVAALLAVALLGGLMLTLFSHKLQTNLSQSNLSLGYQQQVLSQKNKLAGITDFPEANVFIENSFVYGFRWVIGISASLAFLSGVASFLLIKKTQIK